MSEVRVERRPAPSRERDGVLEREEAGYRAPAGVTAATVNRISWGAIFAGGVVALVAQLLFSVLGIAIGLSIVDPLAPDVTAQAIGIGAGIWWVVTGLISLFLGGWTAGYLAGRPLRADGMLHGIVAWGLVTLASFLLVVSGTDAVLGGPLTEIPDAAVMSAWWAFIGMLAGVIAAAFGGALGAPRDLPAAPTARREAARGE